MVRNWWLKKKLYSNFNDAEIISGNNKRERFFVPRINVEQNKSCFPSLEASPVSVISAFTMTISKLQGQLFERDDFCLLSLFLDINKFIFLFIFILIINRTLLLKIEHLQKKNVKTL
jgi:hypothetical protein